MLINGKEYTEEQLQAILLQAERNTKKTKECIKKWKKKNRLKVNKYHREYTKNRIKKDPEYAKKISKYQSEYKQKNRNLIKEYQRLRYIQREIGIDTEEMLNKITE